MALQHGAHEAILGGQTRQPHPRALLQLRLRLVGGVLLWRVVLRRGKPRPAAERAGQDLAPRPAAVLGDLLLALEFRRLLPLRRSSLRQERRQVVLALDHTSCRRQKAIAAGLVEEARVEPLRRVHLGEHLVQDLGGVKDTHEVLRRVLQHVGRRKRLDPHADGAHGAPHEREGVQRGPLIEWKLVQEGVGRDVVELPHVRGHRVHGGKLRDLLQVLVHDEAIPLASGSDKAGCHPLPQRHELLGPLSELEILIDLVLVLLRRVVVQAQAQVHTPRGVREDGSLVVLGHGGGHDVHVGLELLRHVLQDHAVGLDRLQDDSLVPPEILGGKAEGLRVLLRAPQHEVPVSLQGGLGALER
mmetsp:Transcript_9629/g.30057  ORF Transcript_9629/g.30057 Transcript_9629/m.30057 type:complete len:358 (-) Transcript_9629:1105-2178(-)